LEKMEFYRSILSWPINGKSESLSKERGWISHERSDLNAEVASSEIVSELNWFEKETNRLISQKVVLRSELNEIDKQTNALLEKTCPLHLLVLLDRYIILGSSWIIQRATTTEKSLESCNYELKDGILE